MWGKIKKQADREIDYRGGEGGGRKTSGPAKASHEKEKELKKMLL